MKKLLLIFLISIACIAVSTSVRAATPDQIIPAINKGIAFLATQQQADGRWDAGYGSIAETGLILVKLCDNAYEHTDEMSQPQPLDPFDNNPSSPTYFPYADNVIRGFDYLLAIAYYDSVGISSASYIYYTGISMMAVAASNVPDRTVATGPLTGLTYKQVLQGMMDFMADAQNDSDCGIGGWAYYPNQQSWADNSNSGYATIGIGFAGTPSYKFKIPVPPSVITGLKTFIANVQVTSGPYVGGSIYNPCPGWESSTWVNILKAGTLIYEMALAGFPETNPQVLSAVGFIENYFNVPAGVCDGCGWMGDYQAMFLMKKGFAAYDPIDDPAPAFKTITVGGSPVDWFDEVSTYIVNNQNGDGSWIATAGETYSPIVDTAWALLTLEPTVPPPRLIEDCFNGKDDDGDGLIDNADPDCWFCGDGNIDPGEQCDDGNSISGDGCDAQCISEIIPVAVDIKPGSCPNPITLKDQGVLPFAIMGTVSGFDMMGTVQFDVTQIDPQSIRLSLGEGSPEVAPIRWSYYDAGIPNEDFNPELCNCVGAGFDGIIDLALKFNVQEVIKTLGLAAFKGQTIPLTMTGKLKEEFGETPIKGQDCIWVLKK